MPGRPTNVPPETGERLRNIRESLGLNRSEFVEKVGMGLSSLSRMEAGKVPPSAEVIYYLACQHPQVDIRELFCGIPTPSRIDAYEVASQVKPVIRAVGAPIDDLPPENVADDYVAVPMLDGKVAAGPGGVIWEQVKSLVWLYKPQLKGRAKLVAVRVGGDSMVPTVPEGSIVIVDRDQWIPNGGRKNIWAPPHRRRRHPNKEAA